MDFAVFLQEHEYIDFSSPLIIEKAKQLFNQINTDVEKAKIAFEYVRDEIPHSFDITRVALKLFVHVKRVNRSYSLCNYKPYMVHTSNKYFSH